MQRVGIGYDMHRLVEGRKLILGGLSIPFKKGLWGHSDADVLTHAICDALLGALGLGDIGEHFPDTDMQYQNVSSLVLLEKVYGWVCEKGYHLVNVDTIVVANQPNLKPFKAKIVASLAQALSVQEHQVSVKAKTREGFYFGSSQEDAIEAHAVVLLVLHKQ